MIHRDGQPISAEQLKRARSTQIEFFPFWEVYGVQLVPEYEERLAAQAAGIPFPTWRTTTSPIERGGAIAFVRYQRLIDASVQEAQGEQARREAERQRLARGKGA